MATARPAVTRLPAAASTSTSAATVANGGVKASVPTAVSGTAVESDDLCDCGHPAANHRVAAACRYAGACGCVGFTPR